MGEIHDLQGRLAQALARIDSVLAQPKAAPESPVLIDALKDQLEEERVLNSQLEERIKDLHAKQDEQIARHAAEIASLTARLAEAEDNNRSNRAEIDAILADLRPILNEAAHA